MAALAWTMMGLALWHFTIFLPDRFWAGIVGAFVGSVLGAVLFGVLIHGFKVPGEHATNVGTTLEAIPGVLIGVALVYALGVRQEQKAAPEPE